MFLLCLQMVKFCDLAKSIRIGSSGDSCRLKPFSEQSRSGYVVLNGSEKCHLLHSACDSHPSFHWVYTNLRSLTDLIGTAATRPKWFSCGGAACDAKSCEPEALCVSV